MNHDINNNSENTTTLRGLNFDRSRLFQGRDSDIRPANLPADDTENTFVFTVPQRDSRENTPQTDVSKSPFINTEVDEVEADEIVIEAADGDSQRDRTEVYASLDILNETILDDFVESDSPHVTRKPKKMKVSKHGLQYPSLPAGTVKKLATNFARTSGNSKAKINKETLDAILQASDWFFEQIGDDLGAYARHAGRKTIDESDIVTLMAR
jgi:histone H3/H4